MDCDDGAPKQSTEDEQEPVKENKLPPGVTMPMSPVPSNVMLPTCPLVSVSPSTLPTNLPPGIYIPPSTQYPAAADSPWIMT